MTSLPFDVAHGSVPGSHHRRSLGNNQDAAAVCTAPSSVVAAVCDGCGSTPHAEVGARLVARFLVNHGTTLLDGACPWEGPAFGQARSRAAFMEVLRLRTVEYLGGVATGLGGNRVQNVHDLLLCTALVAVVTPTVSWVATIGDGVLSINGGVQVIEQENQPAYLGYELVPRVRSALGPARLRFVERGALPTGALGSLQVASDGATALLDTAAGIPADGPSARGLGGFLQPADVARQNALQRRLVVAGVRAGRARDDTTMVSIVRREGEARDPDG